MKIKKDLLLKIFLYGQILFLVYLSLQRLFFHFQFTPLNLQAVTLEAIILSVAVIAIWLVEKKKINKFPIILFLLLFFIFSFWSKQLAVKETKRIIAEQDCVQIKSSYNKGPYSKTQGEIVIDINVINTCDQTVLLNELSMETHVEPGDQTGIENRSIKLDGIEIKPESSYSTKKSLTVPESEYKVSYSYTFKPIYTTLQVE